MLDELIKMSTQKLLKEVDKYVDVDVEYLKDNTEEMWKLVNECKVPVTTFKEVMNLTEDKNLSQDKLILLSILRFYKE